MIQHNNNCICSFIFSNLEIKEQTTKLNGYEYPEKTTFVYPRCALNQYLNNDKSKRKGNEAN